MGCAVIEGLPDVLLEPGRVHFGMHEEQQINEVLHAGVVPFDARASVSVELFSELLLSRDHAEFGPRQTGEIKPPLPLDLLGRFDQVITDPDIHMKADKRAAATAVLKSATALGAASRFRMDPPTWKTNPSARSSEAASSTIRCNDSGEIASRAAIERSIFLVVRAVSIRSLWHSRLSNTRRAGSDSR